MAGSVEAVEYEGLLQVSRGFLHGVGFLGDALNLGWRWLMVPRLPTEASASIGGSLEAAVEAKPDSTF